MSVDPGRRKKIRKKKKQDVKSKVSKKDKIYGVLALLGVVILAFLFAWLILKDLLH